MSWLEKVKRYLSRGDNNNHNSSYRDKNWIHDSSQSLVLGTLILVWDIYVPGSSPENIRWKYHNCMVLESFLLPLHQASRKFPIMNFWEITNERIPYSTNNIFEKRPETIWFDPKQTSKYKHFLSLWTKKKNITFYFIGFFLFLKKKILWNLCTKIVHENYFCWRYVRIISPIILLLYDCIHRRSVQT